MFNSLRYLILSITCRCNIRCAYCHQGAGEHGMDMSPEVVDAALKLADNGKPVLIQITGGEPALLPGLIDRIGYTSRSMRVPPRLAIQTNGTLLSPELAQLMQKYQMQVGVSIDGPPDIQEKLRGKAGETLRGLGLLEAAGIPFRTTTVVSNTNVLFLDKLALMLSAYGYCRGIGLDLLVNKGRATVSTVSPVFPEHLCKGITRLVQTLNALNRRRRNPVVLREMEMVQKDFASPSFCQAALNQSLAVQSDGSLFPCGQTIGDPRLSWGSVMQPAVPLESPFASLKLQPEECDACPLHNRCPGECPSRIHYNSADDASLACELYRCLHNLS